MSAVQAFLQHLQVERRMSAHTLDAYRRDLDALSVWAEPRGVAVEALTEDPAMSFPVLRSAPASAVDGGKERVEGR